MSRLSASYLGEGRTEFCVWAPKARQVDVHILEPEDRLIPMQGAEKGYFQVVAQDVEPGALYIYRLNEESEFPDPASRFQPRGVHGPSQVMHTEFSWTDTEWKGVPLQDYILYEIHVGTFTAQGTFTAILPYLNYLLDLGITAVELMPIAQFPGKRNWGYDGVYPFAVQNSYGGPDELRQLVNACHRVGRAVILDVVYNHFGPEGNYLANFGYYFTDQYRTPWGEAINFDRAHSDEVRRFFLENALYWIREFHIDGLRLDAVHSIRDFSAQPFLAELTAAVKAESARLGRQIHLIAESALNDSKVVHSRDRGGWEFDAQWNDDFHHSLRTLMLPEKTGYYEDFGELSQFAKALQEGYVYSGQYSSFRKRRHGNSSREIPARKLVVFAQNHDQVGNRRLGERLSKMLSFEGQKLVAAAVILSPFLPLLFMGEEYGEPAPFPYFVSHSDPGLQEAVRKGRWEEFASFQWPGEPPDPQDEATFSSAQLNHRLYEEAPFRVLLSFYKALIRLRREHPALLNLSKDDLEVIAREEQKTLFLRRWTGGHEAVLVFNFGECRVSVELPFSEGRWEKMLDSSEEQWNGPGSALSAKFDSSGEAILEMNAHSFVLFSKGRRDPLTFNL